MADGARAHRTSERRRSDLARAHGAARRLALAALFEAEFGQRTATAILERQLAETEGDPETSRYARLLVGIVVQRRADLDARIELVAPHYPVVALARMDRILLRAGLGEVLHSPATPARVAIAEWVELARTYSGEPMRRLMNGVLGRVARDTSPTREDTQAPGGSQWPARTSG